MQAMIIPGIGQPFKQEEREVSQPGRGEVLVKVHACGVCHSDQVVTEGLWPGLKYPRIAGHEVAGVITKIGPQVNQLAIGARVGVGWHGGHDGACSACLNGKFQNCENALITGVTTDGGYAEYLLTPAVACAKIPDGMSYQYAAPLMCAGMTSFNALRNSGARPGDLVAIQGIGGLGHLAIQYAKAMGFEVAAISRGFEKEAFARQLGAHHYINTETGSAGEKLLGLGGAKTILATSSDAASISALTEGLGIEGCLLIVGIPNEPLSIKVQDMISGNRRIQFWSSGTATDSTDALAFAQKQGIAPIVEVFPLADIEAAFKKMLQGKIRYRAVLQLSAP